MSNAAHPGRPRVLVVAYSFPPHAAIGTMRTLRVVRQLHARGWDVTVLTGDPASYVAGTPVDMALLERVPGEVRVVRAAALRGWSRLEQLLRPVVLAGANRPGADIASNGISSIHQRAAGKEGALRHLAQIKDIIDAALSIPDREAGWLLPALGAGIIEQLRKVHPDVIYSSAPPWTGQLVAAGLKQLLRRPWVADFRDPWSRAPWRGDRYRFAMRAAAVLERFVVRRADRIVFVAAANRDDFASHYGPAVATKFEVVPNGCDPVEFDLLRQSAIPEEGRFVLLHAGTLYAGRTPVPLLNALATAIGRGIIDPNRFTLRFLGVNGLPGVDLSTTCRQLGIERVVEFLPRVPREQSLRAMMSASSLLLLQPGHTVAVPGKLYEYLATGRPILAIAEEGEIASLLRETGAGILVSPDNEAGMVAALASFVERGYAQVALPRRELFDGNMRAAQMADLLETVVRDQQLKARRERIEISGRALP